jgi:hypothetical protein
VPRGPQQRRIPKARRRHDALEDAQGFRLGGIASNRAGTLPIHGLQPSGRPEPEGQPVHAKYVTVECANKATCISVTTTAASTARMRFWFNTVFMWILLSGE